MKHAPRGPVKARPPLDGQTLGLPPAKVKCTGHSSQTGKPCKKWPIRGGSVCATHGGSAPQVKGKAQERLMALQPKAIQTLDALLGRDEYPTVQLGAAKDVLDRTDGKAVDRVELSGKNGGPIPFRWLRDDEDL